MKQITRDPNAKTILGIDSSTTGVAWTLSTAEGPKESGKLKLDKIKGMADKMAAISNWLPAFLAWHRPSYIYVEMPIFVKNPATARSLTFIVGCIMTNAIQHGYTVELVEPATWKAHIGYHNLSSKFQAEAKAKLGKTEGSKLCDRLRKSQTMRIINHVFPDVDTSDHDVSDSCAISLYGLHQKVCPMPFEKNKEVAFDLRELATMGLSI